MIILWLVIVFFSFIWLLFNKRKGYVLGFVLWYPILPESFGIRISESFPVLSVNRILLLVSLAMFMKEKKGRLSLSMFKANAVKAFYFFVLVPSIINVFISNSSILSILSFGIETVAIMIICYEYGKTESIDKMLKFLVVGGSIAALIGVIQTITNVNIADSMFQVKEAITLDIRFGFTRANGTFNNSITFGYFCCFMLLFGIYLERKTKKISSIISLGLFAAGVVASFTRGAILFMFLIFAGMVVIDAKAKRISTRKAVFSLSLIVLVPTVVYIIFTKIPSIAGIFEATFRALDQNYYTNEVNNNYALYSRFEQLSVIEWLIINNRIITGYGSRFLSDRMIAYYHYGQWWHIPTMDMGYAEIFASGGLLKFSGYLILFVFLIRQLMKNRREKDRGLKMTRKLLLSCMSFFILVNFSTIFYAQNICVITYALAMSYIVNNKKNRILYYG